MKTLITTTAFTVAILLLFMGGTSVTATWLCSDSQGNEVYTDRNRGGCREFTPMPPNDIEAKPSAKTPKVLKKSDQRRGATTELDHKGASYSDQDLLSAVASGDKGKTELLLRSGISANAKDEQGQSALAMAAALPSVDIAALLMTHGADVNARSHDGATPLMAAMMAGQKDTAKLLLRKGADVKASAPVGSPAPRQMPMLFLAIAIGDAEITKLLIEEGADLNATLSDGQQQLSPLAFAQKTNQQNIVQLLSTTGTKKSPLEAHIRQLEDRLTSLCKDAGEQIYEMADNVEGVYIHVQGDNAGKAFGYYHEKDRVSATYLSPARGTNYRFWEMDAVGKAGVIYHQRLEAYFAGRPGEQVIELKQVALPVATYGITWRPLTGTEDQRQGLYGEELKIFEVKTERVLAVRTAFFYAITETTVDASGATLPLSGGPKLYRFATCPNYNPGPDYAYTDLRPRDSYQFVSKVLRPVGSRPSFR